MRDIVHIGLDVGSTTVKIVILDKKRIIVPQVSEALL